MYRSDPLAIKLNEVQNIGIGSNVAPKQVQLLRTGKFYSNEYGEIEITKETLDSMVKNFKEKVRGVDLAVDYKHESEDIAAGWFKNVYTLNEGNELWAEVEWTKNGQSVLENKEFRYISAEFDFDYKGNESSIKFGPTLYGAGLTNRPFIKDMAPVIDLSEIKTKGKAMDEKDKKISELEALVAELKTKITELEGKKPVPTATSESTDGTDVNALKAELEEMKTKIKDYQEKEKKFEEEKKLAEKTSSFNKLLTEGKVVEAQRSAYLSGDVLKFAENAKPVNMKASGSSQEPPTVDGSKNPQEEILKLAAVKLSEKKVSDLGEAVKLVLSENPELKKLYQTV